MSLCHPVSTMGCAVEPHRVLSPRHHHQQFLNLPLCIAFVMANAMCDSAKCHLT